MIHQPIILVDIDEAQNVEDIYTNPWMDKKSRPFERP